MILVSLIFYISARAAPGTPGHASDSGVLFTSLFIPTWKTKSIRLFFGFYFFPLFRMFSTQQEMETYLAAVLARDALESTELILERWTGFIFFLIYIMTTFNNVIDKRCGNCRKASDWMRYHETIRNEAGGGTIMSVCKACFDIYIERGYTAFKRRA